MAKDLTAPEPSFLKGLTDLQKAYVRCLFEVAPGHGQGARAVRAAGYQAKDAASVAAIAYQLSTNEKVRNAVIEMAKIQFRGQQPTAVGTVVGIMNNEEAKDADRLKAAAMVLKRTDPEVTKTDVTVKVEIDRDKARREAIRFYAKRLTREQLIEDWGQGAVDDALPPDTVEGQFTVIEPPKPEEPKPTEPIDWDLPISEWKTTS